MKRKFAYTATNSGGSTSQQRYLALDGGFIQDSDVTKVYNRLPIDGTIRNLKVRLQNAPGNGGSYTFTVYVGVNPSGVTCTITDPDTEASDLEHSVNVSAGDMVSLGIMPSGDPAPTAIAGPTFLVEFESTNTSTCLCSNHATLSTSTDYIPPCGEYEGQSLEDQNTIGFPIAAAINEFHVNLVTAPGGVTWRKFTVYVDGSPTDTEIQITGSATSGSVTGKSIAITAGQKLTIRHTRNGAVAGSIGYFGIVYTPTTAGQFAISNVQNYTTLGSGVTGYLGPSSSLTKNSSATKQVFDLDVQVNAICAYANDTASVVATLIQSDGDEEDPTVDMAGGAGPVVADGFTTTLADEVYCTKVVCSGGTARRIIVSYGMTVLDLIGEFEVALSDALEVIGDSIARSSASVRSAAISDSLEIISESIATAGLTESLFADLSDALGVISDAIGGSEYADIARSVSDTLQIIQDAASAGLIPTGWTDVRMTEKKWVAPLTITPLVDDIDEINLAAHAVRRPTRYYQPRVESYGTFDRSIACPAGFVRTGDVQVQILDPDNAIRQAISPKTLRKAIAELRLGPEDGSFASFLRPWKRQVGPVEQPSDGRLSITFRDFVYDWMDWQIPSAVDATRYPNMPESNSPEFSPLVIGSVDSQGGAIACPLIDTISFRYLVARHACRSVLNVWRKTGSEAEFTVVDPSEYAFVQASGDVGCMIDFVSDQQGAEIRADVEGLYDEGTGALLYTNFADAISLIFFYVAGISVELDRINLDSFDEVKTKTAALLCAGAITQPMTFGEVLTQLQRSSNIDIFCDKNDRVTVAFSADEDAATANLDDILRLYKGTIRQAMAEPTYNRIRYRYAPNYAAGTWTEETYDNPADQTATGEVNEEEPLHLYFVRDAGTALAVAEYRAEWLDLDSFRFEGEVPLIPTVEELELAQIVNVTHFGGIKSGGYVAEQFKLLSLSMDIDNLKYGFKGIRRRLPPTPHEETVIDETVTTGRFKNNSRVGPHDKDVEGELFVVLADPANLVVIRTTDFGATWAAYPATSLANDIGSFDTVASNGYIHCAVQEEETARVSYWVFSMHTLQWTVQNDEVVEHVANADRHCVSIEIRYPADQVVIFFQGDRELYTGAYWARGYLSTLSGGTWSVPLQVTPNPGYQPNWDENSSNCYIERVMPGRENRLHFFWANETGDNVAHASGGEWRRTMQGDDTLSGAIEWEYTTGWMYSAADHNIGDACLIESRSKIVLVRKGWGGTGIADVYAEGPSLISLGYCNMTFDAVFEGADENFNPAMFVRESGIVLYCGMAQSGASQFVAMSMSYDGGITWTAPVQAGAAYPGNQIQVLDGTIIPVRGRLYVSYLSGPHSFLGGYAYRWFRVSDLPYTT